jgi:predicted DCC family thiol-disulfide oxidoreductase YuxK
VLRVNEPQDRSSEGTPSSTPSSSPGSWEGQGGEVDFSRERDSRRPETNPILLYDGVCGLCNRLTQFILRHDHRAIFRFASLQSAFAASILTRHAANPTDLDTVAVVLNHNESGEALLPRSDAILFILDQLGGFWRFTARVFSLVSRPASDWAYGLVARHRYGIFGRYDACPLPTEATRARFLDQ